MNYGEYLRIIRKYCINPKIKNEDLVNNPLEELIRYGNVRKVKKPKELLYYESTEACKIVNNNLEISNNLRDCLCREGIEDVACRAMEFFYEDYIDKHRTGEMIDHYLSEIERDQTYSKAERSKVRISSNSPGIFLGILLLKSLKENNYNGGSLTNDIWSRGNSYIRIIEGNLFQYALGKRSSHDRIVVIPVNTGFDVHVTTKQEETARPLVSSNTLHGQFLLRVYKGVISEKELHDRIVANLLLNGYLDSATAPIVTEIGTVAALDFGKASIYLLAVSAFDENNNARSSRDDITTALERLLDYYGRKGQGDELYIPLIGTGLSRANITNQESLDLIRDTMLHMQKQLSGKINIVVTPEVMKTIMI